MAGVRVNRGQALAQPMLSMDRDNAIGMLKGVIVKGDSTPAVFGDQLPSRDSFRGGLIDGHPLHKFPV